MFTFGRKEGASRRIFVCLRGGEIVYLLQNCAGESFIDYPHKADKISLIGEVRGSLQTSNSMVKIEISFASMATIILNDNVKNN